VRTESHVGLVPGEVRGRDVIALVIMHAYQLRRKNGLCAE